jgi:anti-sigma-K factor RskA
MNQRSHDDMKSLIAPYALGAVSPDEERAIRAHLPSCDECSAEAAVFADTAGRLALSANPVALPEGFSERVLTLVAQPAPEAARHGRRRRTMPALVGASVAFAVVAALLGYLFLDARRDLITEQAVTAALLRDDGLRVAGDGAVGAVVPAEGGSVFVAEGLADVPDGRTYQLWLIEGETPVPAGTFETEDGRAVHKTGRSLEGFSGAAVTIEPEGGSPEPTTDPVLTPA